MKPADASRPVLPPLLFLLGLTVLLVWSCRAPIASRSGWDEGRWGPLVPHDEFPADCSLCHMPDRWDTLKEDFQFDHEKETGYALEGVHQQASCLRCHNDRGPVSGFLARGCSGCHPDPHQGTMTRECGECHDQWSWQPTGALAEHARTRFPLVGAHAAVSCDDCHVLARTGVYEGLTVQCEFCHLGDALAARSVNHGAQGWVTDCQRCHSPATWGGDFAHTTWPLTGQHRDANCSDCHQNGVFRGTPRNCFSCHMTDYQGATNPNHAANAYPTSCEICHNTSAWRPANFNHRSQFPLTGDHANLNCTDCHNGGNFNTFSCLSCHVQPDTDNDHSGVSGYVYSSPACLACHPTGKAD